MSLIAELASRLQGRVVVAGVGNDSHGDDAAGPSVARALRAAGLATAVDCGPCPELETWRIRDLAPTTVLFVDAVDFGGQPGDVALLGKDDLRDEGWDTHRAPLRLTMHYLEKELSAQCWVLAIQPKETFVSAPMSPEVKQAVENLTGILVTCLLAEVSQ